MAEENKPEKQESNCIRCGKCVEYCPAKLAPILISENLNKPEKIKKLEPCKCIECGLCSYICPAKINLREKVLEAKQKTREER